MTKDEMFFSPTLTGKRFDDHSIPIELLGEFAAVEELLKALAKKIYLEEHPGRKRVPNGFTDNVSLNLSTIEEGSTKLNFFLATTLLGSSLLPLESTSYSYFEKAKSKVIEIVSAAESNKNVEDIVDKRYLNYFNKIGKNLKAGEEMYLLPGDKSKSPKINKEVRKKIMLSASPDNTYADYYDLKVLIDSLNRTDKTFAFVIDGNRLEAKLSPIFYRTILETFSDLDNDRYVSIKGLATFSSNDKIIQIDSITSLELLPTLDVSVRLKNLSKLKDGWFNGEGKGFTKNSLERLEGYFYSNYPQDQQLPAIFPTPDGNIQMEWTIKDSEISLEINLLTYEAELMTVNAKSGDSEVDNVNVSVPETWVKINDLIINILNA
ncbi:hypothetical protein ABIC45_001235 [Mucilaginibacter rubeus]|uniref:hypothetical protein n=1 Tax=Mucilaginibacter rubeus TaxID=2027860 RepID=UPI00339B31EC